MDNPRSDGAGDDANDTDKKDPTDIKNDTSSQYQIARERLAESPLHKILKKDNSNAPNKTA